jgi:glyoxylase-like metal-dependent hydrolase (beta-lactamase superfamily II)
LNARHELELHQNVGWREYLIICTHVHFDHIGGINTFPPSHTTIVASGYDKDFVSPLNRDKNSLCATVGMHTPEYNVSQFAADMEWFEYGSERLGL